MNKDDSQPSSAIVAGSTGLVGTALRRHLTPSIFNPVWLLARTPQSDDQPHQHWVKTDFNDWPDTSDMHLQGATLFCSLGTTIKKAGSAQAFIELDRDIVVNTAHWARDHGVRNCLFVSSLGANLQSRQLYLRTKGEAEQELIALGFDRLVLMRPSLLLGERTEFRLAERLSAIGAGLFRPLLAGPLLKYRPVPASQVAAAMVYAAIDKGPAIDIWESDRISRHRMD